MFTFSGYFLISCIVLHYLLKSLMMLHFWPVQGLLVDLISQILAFVLLSWNHIYSSVMIMIVIKSKCSEHSVYWLCQKWQWISVLPLRWPVLQFPWTWMDSLCQQSSCLVTTRTASSPSWIPAALTWLATSLRWVYLISKTALPCSQSG